MGFFDAFGVNANDVDENVFRIPKAKYNVVLQEAGVKEYKGIPYFELVWAVADGPHQGKTAKDMHRLTPWTPSETDEYQTRNARAVASFKKLLLDLGIPANALNQFDPNAHGPRLVGLKGSAIMGPQKNNPEFNAISSFSRNAVGAVPATVPAPAVSEEKMAEESAAVDDLLSNFK